MEIKDIIYEALQLSGVSTIQGKIPWTPHSSVLTHTLHADIHSKTTGNRWKWKQMKVEFWSKWLSQHSEVVSEHSHIVLTWMVFTSLHEVSNISMYGSWVYSSFFTYIRLNLSKFTVT